MLRKETLITKVRVASAVLIILPIQLLKVQRNLLLSNIDAGCAAHRIITERCMPNM